MTAITLRSVAFEVLGIPAPQGSKRPMPFYKGRGAERIMAGLRVVDDNARTMPWRQEVAACARKAWTDEPITGPVELRVGLRFARPKSHYRTGKNAGELKSGLPFFKPTAPDSLKCVRAIEDALSGIVYADDSQVCEHHIVKVYCLAGQAPGAHIEVKELEP